MADPQSYRPKTRDIPTEPGVYRFIDPEGRVIYVGKAKNLRNRLSNYFQSPDRLHPRTRQMVFTAERVVWVVVKSEIEALTLEYAWIKEFEPRFNVMYRDDKSYPYLAITTAEEYPRMLITRSSHRKGNKYYGPYTKVWAVRESVDLLQKVFPIRTCTKGVFNSAQRTGRPCLNGYIGLCVAPCVGRVSAQEHRAIVNDLVRFLDSTGEEMIASKTDEMKRAASEQRFEDAARLRDQAQALRTIAEKNTVALGVDLDADIFGIEVDEIEVSVQVFYVRAGRIRGQRGWVSDVETLDVPELLSQLILQVYGGYDGVASTKRDSDAKSVDDVAHTATSAIPKEIWLPQMPAERTELEQWLSSIRTRPVRIVSPQRGKKAALMETVHTNAVQAMQRHKLQRVGDLTERSQALEELRVGLHLKRAPLRIEGFDISHTQGTYQVASMVVFEDGAPKKKEYRHFTVRGENGTGARDDTAAMEEVLRRRLLRLQALLDHEEEMAHGNTAHIPHPQEITELKRFAYKPDLIVVDGGLPQVNAAQRVVDELGVDVMLVGLAKRLEEVWIPGEEFPVILPRTSPALRLLQYLRDESHRFAITFHRNKRGKGMLRSTLDSIEGLGPAKQKALIKHFGSVKRMKEATEQELQEVAGIGPVLAQTIYAALHDVA
ncbi:MAG: excinuclease ABC subunit UvrC [Actinomycetaceae bacterium]|nr:excinuclease ABC subunit UvrC [Arcanobacterium sp.]MDD7505774.1 excinuclease ABC subunit UvrC [Actinomycetaceae bacterium]MDY6143627.1 excinuclease ABC subunit UvrC [Arcanobacterium sp.]